MGGGHHGDREGCMGEGHHGDGPMVMLLLRGPWWYLRPALEPD